MMAMTVRQRTSRCQYGTAAAAMAVAMVKVGDPLVFICHMYPFTRSCRFDVRDVYVTTSYHTYTPYLYTTSHYTTPIHHFSLHHTTSRLYIAPRLCTTPIPSDAQPAVLLTAVLAAAVMRRGRSSPGWSWTASPLDAKVNACKQPTHPSTHLPSFVCTYLLTYLSTYLPACLPFFCLSIFLSFFLIFVFTTYFTHTLFGSLRDLPFLYSFPIHRNFFHGAR